MIIRTSLYFNAAHNSARCFMQQPAKITAFSPLLGNTYCIFRFRESRTMET